MSDDLQVTVTGDNVCTCDDAGDCDACKAFSARLNEQADRVFASFDKLQAARKKLNLPAVSAEKREQLGRYVRHIWMEWAREQADVQAGAHANWLTPWEQLGERDREVDMRIGERLYLSGFMDGRKR